MIAEWNGAEIARSADCIVCDSTIYFPRADLRREFIRPGIFRSHCPRKGDAEYFDLSVNGRGLTHAAWHYPAPAADFAELTDHVAFWRGVEVREAESSRAPHQSGANTGDPAELIRAFVSRVPKTEIHLRLETFATGDAPLDPAALVRAARDYLQRNRVFYAEIFWAPAFYASSGKKYDALADALDAAAQRIKNEDRVHIKFLTDVSQSDGLPAAEKILESLLAYPRDTIIGVANSGPETAPGKSARTYAPVFERARAAGLHVVSMAGEMFGPSHVWDALNATGVERLGHATSAILDERLLDHLRDRQLPLTLCLSSNTTTRAYVHELREHPVRAFFERGLNVTLNSDCPAITGAELTDEYMNLHKFCGFDLNEIILLMRNNLNATFLSPRNKLNCWKQIEDRIRSLQTELQLQITVP